MEKHFLILDKKISHYTMPISNSFLKLIYEFHIILYDKRGEERVLYFTLDVF